jgi:signal transduction histidine kinase
VLFALSAVGLALVLAVLLGRRAARPLMDLEKTMGLLSRGEFGVEVPVEGPSEIRSVGAALNSMSRELVRRNEELQLAHAQLVQSEKLSAIGELAASVAHEVKNPMVGIVGFAQLAQESKDPAEIQEYLGLIEQDGFRANAILQSLLEFSRPPEVALEVLQVNEVVEGALRLCRHQVALGGARVETRLADGLPAIRGNSNQLRQVLLNLVLNASQAMEGAPVRRLTIATALAVDGWVELEVIDTGPGIAPDVKARLFKAFFTTKRPGQGTGLGLSVSRTIVEAHHGAIRVESTPGEGATFIVRLPPAG